MLQSLSSFSLKHTSGDTAEGNVSESGISGDRVLSGIESFFSDTSDAKVHFESMYVASFYVI